MTMPIYKPGRRVPNIHTLIFMVDRGDYLYHAGRAMHPAFVLQMRVSTLLKHLAAGEIYEAELIDRPQTVRTGLFIS